jgi:uncharacterized membrane protein YfcA
MDLSPLAFTSLVAVAGAAGFVDAIAGGGGLLTVPALLAAGVPPVSMLATNKLQSSFGTAVACANYARKGHVDFKAMAVPVAATFTGSVAGAVLVQRLGAGVLAGLVPVLLIAMAGYFLFSPKMSEVDQHKLISVRAYSIIGAAIGFYDGFFGPGAGAFYMLSLITLLGLGLIRATGHTKLLNLTSNVAALITLSFGGHMLWMLGGCMAVANMAGGQLGSMTAMKHGSRIIKPLLVIVSLGMTVKLLSDPANPLRKLILGH